MILHDKYQLLQVVSKSNFSTVHKAVDSNNSRVAVQQISIHSDSHQQQIEHRINTIVNLSNVLPFVPKIYEYWSEQGNMYLAMEWCDGETVWDLRNQAWPAVRVEHFLHTVLGYLAAMHARGVIHGALHPSNIKRDPGQSYMLLDFGVAEVGLDSLVQGSQIPYTAPEQLDGEILDARSDLYTLGATTYHLLTGQAPPTAAERRNGVPLQRPRRLVPNVPLPLERTLLCMLEVDPANRLSSADDVLEMLDQTIPVPVQHVSHQPTNSGRRVVPPIQRVSRQPTAPNQVVMPPVQPAEHNKNAQQTFTRGCIWMPIFAVVAFIIGSLCFLGGLIFAPGLGMLGQEQSQTVQSSAVTGTQPDPTALAQVTPTLARPTEIPESNTSASAGIQTVTATRGVDSDFRPREAATNFTDNEQIYIAYQIDDAEAGEPVRFTCYSNDQVCWEWTEYVRTSTDYAGYFVVGPLNPGTYRGEVAYKDKVETVVWEIR
jgi:serine/threonine protein kinase